MQQHIVDDLDKKKCRWSRTTCINIKFFDLGGIFDVSLILLIGDGVFNSYLDVSIDDFIKMCKLELKKINVI